jgi:predicted dehydrogenase
MKQLLQSLKTGATAIAEVPIPAAQPGRALVRTAASLVSAGTERMVVDFAQKSVLGKARARPDLVRQFLHKARREGILSTLDAARARLDQPMPLGYASAGTIIALGEGVTGFRAGDRVACAGGGYANHAEYALIPANLLATLPDSVPFEHAAFATLGAIALHGFRLAQPQLGERVAIIGLGLLGQLTLGIARAAGCPAMGIDLDPARVTLAEQMGFTGVTRPEAEEAAPGFTRARGFDAVLICADTPSDDPVNLAGIIARDRARVVAVGAVGLNIPRKIYFAKEISFINSRSYGPGRYDTNYEAGGRDYPIGYVRWTEGRNLEAFVELLAGGLDVAPLITHRFPIDDAPRAYELITGKRKEPFLGVVLTYPENDDRRLKIEDRRSEIETPDLRSSIFDPTATVVRLGVLGAGNFATAVMLPAVKKIAGVELVGVASASGLGARHAAEKFGFRFAAGGEAEILADPDINTVAVLTRHGDHARLAAAALRAGKHVFVEKPLAISAAQLDEIAGAAHESPLQMTVGFNRRFAPLAVRMHEFIGKRTEPLHATYRVNAGYLPPDHWLHDPEQGGGRIIGEGCHFVDFLTHLVGAPPREVRAVGLPDQGKYRNDNVQLDFTFPDGSVGTVIYLANGDKSAAKERVEVFAGGRVAVLDDFRALELVHDGRRAVYRARLRQDKGHAGIWAAFAAAVLGGGEPPIPYAHLLGVTRATFAAVAALRSGAAVGIEYPVSSIE